MDNETLREAIAEARARPIVGRSHPLRGLAAVLALLLMAWIINVLLRNPAFEWSVVVAYLFHPNIMRGLVTTLWLTAAVTGLSIVLGTAVAAMRLSSNYILQVGAWGYVWIFRSTPLLVQLLFWFNIGYLFPKITLGLPFGPVFYEINSRDLISPLSAALLGLTLHVTSYASEIIRGGISSVPAGQIEAAEVLGISSRRIFMRIVLPQSMRSIIPSIGNLLIDTLKSTSIISVLAVPDLLYSAQIIYNKNYKVIPLLIIATLWYVIITTILSVAQYRVEKYFARGAARKASGKSDQGAGAMLQSIFSRKRRAA